MEIDSLLGKILSTNFFDNKEVDLDQGGCV